MTVNMGGDFECIMRYPRSTGHSNAQAIAGTTLLMSFSVMMVLLLSNMLIASMAKTFDNVYSEQEVNFAFQKARNMLNAEFMDPLPPPLNILTMPFWLLRFALLVGSLGNIDIWPDKSSEKKGLVTWLARWNKKVKHAEATAYVLQFVMTHENLAVESGKWRTRLITRLGANFSRLEQSVDSQEQVMKALDRKRTKETNVMLTKRLDKTEATLSVITKQLESLGASTASTSTSEPRMIRKGSSIRGIAIPVAGPTSGAAATTVGAVDCISSTAAATASASANGAAPASTPEPSPPASLQASQAGSFEYQEARDDSPPSSHDSCPSPLRQNSCGTARAASLHGAPLDALLRGSSATRSWGTESEAGARASVLSPQRVGTRRQTPCPGMAPTPGVRPFASAACASPSEDPGGSPPMTTSCRVPSQLVSPSVGDDVHLSATARSTTNPGGLCDVPGLIRPQPLRPATGGSPPSATQEGADLGTLCENANPGTLMATPMPGLLPASMLTNWLKNSVIGMGRQAEPPRGPIAEGVPPRLYADEALQLGIDAPIFEESSGGEQPARRTVALELGEPKVYSLSQAFGS